MRRIACTVICVWLCMASAAAAAPLVSGTVTASNGIPLSDVAVRVEIRSEATARSTDDQGRFGLDAAELFSADEMRDAVGLMLKFSKPGFQPVNKFVRLFPGQAPGSVTVRLNPTGGSAALDPAVKQALDKYAAAPGNHPLFLIPYELSGIQAADSSKVNEMLRSNLERVIVTHLQASAVGEPSLVSLKLLPVASARDIDQMRVYGNYLKALGMITGVGAVEAAAGGPGSLEVSSTFLVMPQADLVGAPVLYVDDALPADRVLSPRLYQYLSKLWGRSTVLALGVGEFGRAKAANDKEALKRVRKYLQAERSGAGPGDQALVSQLNALIAAVDKELVP